MQAGKKFMDVTNTQDLGHIHQTNSEAVAPAAVYPSSVSHQTQVNPLLDLLEKDNMKQHLTTFSGFHTRYYKSQDGRRSSNWLLRKLNATIAESGATGVTVKAFDHSWVQNSVIVTIPGQTDKTIIVGAHQDSINQRNPSTGAAPGADDDGSGVVTIWEAMRVLLTDRSVRQGSATNTVEFHFYSAEEGGLLGSQDIFKSYKSDGRSVVAMLQQDMTGYVQGTLDAGKPESFGIITDHVDAGLTSFVKKVIDAYCDIPYVTDKCGYACSDHASATKAGYPSAFVFESTLGNDDPRIHTEGDTIDLVSFDHMIQFAKMTVGTVYELAFAKFA